jgi:hypothetical protein
MVKIQSVVSFQFKLAGAVPGAPFGQTMPPLKVKFSNDFCLANAPFAV